MFALTESLAQGEPLGALLAGLYAHPVLTTGVGIACGFLILGGDKRFLATIFPLAVAGHVSWNYLILRPSPAAKVVTFAIFIAVITLTTWKYLNLRFGSSSNSYSSFLETT